MLFPVEKSFEKKKLTLLKLVKAGQVTNLTTDGTLNALRRSSCFISQPFLSKFLLTPLVKNQVLLP